MSTKRRTFLKQVTLASAVTQAAAQTPAPAAATPTSPAAPEIAFPRVFTGRRLTAIAFPLGGVCAGCVSLGGRGQLRDWEIFNRPDKGNAPSYAFPAIWAQAGNMGALSLGRTIAPGAHADYTFLLAWHFPNRTPRRCGWSAAPGDEDTLIGNHYATRESTIPAAIKDAASANLSTLVTPVCFRTADGEFHGFEGANDHVTLIFPAFPV